MSLKFSKMNGAGNDFVIFDGRDEKIALSPGQVRSIAARANSTTGGCDQVIVLENSKKADVFMRIYNADGGEVSSCGNATRCVAAILEGELEKLPVTIETRAGILQGLQKAYTDDEQEYILVDMGEAKFGEKDIPLAMNIAQATKKVTAFADQPLLKNPAFVSMGNPHVVFLLEKFSVEALDQVDLERVGPGLEKLTDVFPEGVNVSVAVIRPAKDGLGHIAHARVWERGAGFTKACGTAACAILAAAHARDESVADIHLWFEPEGFVVTVKLENGHILLGGPVETEFEGTVNV